VMEVFEHAWAGSFGELGEAIGIAGEHEHVLGEE